MNTTFLTSEEVLFIHDQAIKRFGGSLGLRDVHLLESAIGRPQASYAGEELYLSIFDKAAALAHSLLKNHPFVDGNKRTAIASVGIFLLKNEYTLTLEKESTISFALQIENNSISLEVISAWLKEHAKSK